MDVIYLTLILVFGVLSFALILACHKLGQKK